MNNIGLYNAIRAAHKAFNGALTEELCALARKRIKRLRKVGDARAIRDIDFLSRAIAFTGASV